MSGLDVVHLVSGLTPHPVSLKDRLGRYQHVNDALCTAVGRSREEMLQHTDARLFGTDDARRIGERDRRMMAMQQPTRARESVEVDGTRLQVRALRLPVFGSQGEISGLLTVWIEHQPAEAGPTDSVAPTEDENTVEGDGRPSSSDPPAAPVPAAETPAPTPGSMEEEDTAAVLLTALNHDLRTSITAVLGFSEMLMTEVKGEQRNFARKLRRSATQIHRVLENVLQMARRKQAPFQTHRQVVDLRNTVRVVAQHLTPDRDGAPSPIEVDLPDHPVQLQTDRSLVYRTLLRLCRNAARFTPREGAVHLRLADEAPGARIHVDCRTTEAEAILWRVAAPVFGTETGDGPHHRHEYSGPRLDLELARHYAAAVQADVRLYRQPGGLRLTMHVPALDAETGGDEAV